jgi:serine/threonine-protein kinase
MATSPDGFLARRFDAPDALPGTVAGRDIPSLVAAGRLDFEDEYFETSDGHWQPIWRFPGVSPPARWDALRRSRASDMARQLALARQGLLTREEYIRWREMQLARVGTEGAPTLIHSTAGDTGALGGDWADASIPDRVRATWEHVRTLGHGGTGRVHLVRNRHTGVECALKVTRPDMPREAVVNELKSLERIRSPHVVQVREYEPLGDGRWLIFTEHVPGLTLREHLQSLPGGRVGEAAEVRLLLLGIARGLADLHRQGLVHRDLKPANIMLRQEAPGHGEFTPVIIDLGMARGAQPAGMTILGGTSGYQSPEQLDGQPCTPASDVFTFGLIAYELLTGRKMAGGRLVALHEACPGVPAALDKLVKEDCTSYEQSERPPDGTALLLQLQSLFPPPTHFGTAAQGAISDSGVRIEEIVERLIAAHEFEKAIDNCRIERAQGRNTATLAWQCARASRMSGRNADAFESYLEAIRLAGTAPADLRQEFAKFLAAMGRLEEAAEQYAQMFAETPDDAEASDYLHLLLELNRPEDASRLALERGVVPSEAEVLERVVVTALDRGLFSYVIECGDRCDELGIHSLVVRAATGIALHELDDHVRAEPLLQDGQEDRELGPRAQRCLWACLMKLRRFPAALSLGARIGDADERWLKTHASALIFAALKSHDALRLARLVGQLGTESCPQEQVDHAFELLMQGGHVHEALAIALEDAVRLSAILPVDRSMRGLPPSLTVRLDKLAAGDANASASRQRREAAIRRLVDVLGKIQGSAAVRASLASQAIAAGIDGTAIRQARLDGDCAIDVMLSDAGWLRNCGAFDDQQQWKRLLDAAAEADRSSGTCQWVGSVVALLPRWPAPKIELLRRGLADHAFEPLEAQVALARKCATDDSEPSEVRNQAIQSIARWQFSRWISEEDGWHRVIQTMAPAERLQLVQCALNSNLPEGRPLAAELAIDGSMFQDANAHIQALRLVSDTPGADDEGRALRTLVYVAIAAGNEPEAEAACATRSSRTDGGMAVACTMLAALSNTKLDPKQVLSLSERGEEAGEFAALTFGLRGVSLASLGEIDRAILELQRCLAELSADQAMRPSSAVASTFGITADHVRLQLGICLEAKERFHDAAEHLLAVSESNRDQRWHEHAAHSLWQDGRGNVATTLIRTQILRAPRSMKMVWLRFRFEDRHERSKATKDAAALAARRLPWCKHLAADDICPILPDEVGAGGWAAAPSSQSDESAEHTEAWREISDLLIGPAMETARSIQEAQERVDELRPIASVPSLARAEAWIKTHLAVIADAERLMGLRSKFMGITHFAGERPAAEEIERTIDGLSKHHALAPTLSRFQDWAMRVLVSQHVTGSKQQVRDLASRLRRSNLYRSMSQPGAVVDRRTSVMLAATERAAGDEVAAMRRLNALFAAGTGIDSVRNKAAAIQAGFRPCVEQWDWMARVVYFGLSPNRRPRSLRLIALALFIIALLYPPGDITRWGMWSLLAWFTAGAVILPSPPRESEGFRLLETIRRIERGDFWACMALVWLMILLGPLWFVLISVLR